MARLSVTAALVVVVVALAMAADASIYRTIITTEVSQGSRESEQCQSEMQRVDMSQCESYIRSASSQSEEQQQYDVPQECCEQLRKLSQPCRCPAVAQAMQQATGGYQGQRTVETAQRLTGMCNVEPQHCDVRQQGY